MIFNLYVISTAIFMLIAYCTKMRSRDDYFGLNRRPKPINKTDFVDYASFEKSNFAIVLTEALISLYVLVYNLLYDKYDTHKRDGVSWPSMIPLFVGIILMLVE